MIKGFFDGVYAYGNSIRIISNNRLWIYVLVPAVISVLLAIGIFSTAFGLSGQIGDWLISLVPFDWAEARLGKVIDIITGIFIVAIGLILFKSLVMALSSPFMSFLSEKVEKKMRGIDDGAGMNIKQFISDLFRGIRIALRNLIRELFYIFVLFMLGLFLPIISPFTTAAIFLVQAYFAGFGNIDYTLERHLNVGGSVRFVKANRGLAMGNGAIFMLLLFTGIGFLFALPLGTVAATTETLKRL